MHLIEDKLEENIEITELVQYFWEESISETEGTYSIEMTYNVALSKIPSNSLFMGEFFSEMFISSFAYFTTEEIYNFDRDMFYLIQNCKSVLREKTEECLQIAEQKIKEASREEENVKNSFW